MASSSGTSSGSVGKRMISNRESARRSRMRKQKHLDDLMTQLAHLRNGNNQILTSMCVTTQHYLNIEDENSILRVQVYELANRLESLTEIINANSSGNGQSSMVDGLFRNESWNYMYSNYQPIMTADIMQY